MAIERLGDEEKKRRREDGKMRKGEEVLRVTCYGLVWMCTYYPEEPYVFLILT